MSARESASVLLALYTVRQELESVVGVRVAVMLREYFMHPSLPVSLDWPETWRDLAGANARLGRSAGRA